MNKRDKTPPKPCFHGLYSLGESDNKINTVVNDSDSTRKVVGAVRSEWNRREGVWQPQQEGNGVQFGVRWSGRCSETGCCGAGGRAPTSLGTVVTAPVPGARPPASLVGILPPPSPSDHWQRLPTNFFLFFKGKHRSEAGKSGISIETGLTLTPTPTRSELYRFPTGPMMAPPTSWVLGGDGS